MNLGCCHVTLAAVRANCSDSAEMTSQLLFGDHFKILEKQKDWAKIKITFDGYEGWIDKKQYTQINKLDFESLNEEPTILTNELIDFIEDDDKKLLTVVLGSRLPHYSDNIFKLNDKSNQLTKSAVQ